MHEVMTGGSFKVIRTAMLGKQEEKQTLKSTKNPKLRSFLIFPTVIITAIFFFSFSSFHILGFGHNQDQNSTSASNADERASSDSSENQALPVRLKIPAINVDAAIEYVGLDPEGAMDVPSETTNIGWFNLGPRPGEKGSAVVAGHYNGNDGKEGVFNNLHKLKPGDLVLVEQEDGQSITFVVRKTQIYNPGYADVVFGLSDSAYLNLITCDGTWDEVAQTYSKRLVVFTDILK